MSSFDSIYVSFIDDYVYQLYFHILDNAYNLMQFSMYWPVHTGNKIVWKQLINSSLHYLQKMFRLKSDNFIGFDLGVFLVELYVRIYLGLQNPSFRF